MLVVFSPIFVADTKIISHHDFVAPLRKKKWLVISIYRPPLELLSCFLDSLTNMIDFFSSSYDNFTVMGDFISQPTDSIIKDFFFFL